MTTPPVYVTVATAGHVDHGKSCLVHALTGTDPDRLPEERRRGMTIELGFAALPRPDGGTVALIDTPGHERLVETMVGGAGGIDAALLVVAADDGPMPQTREHLRVLDLLGIRDVVVALTKSDLVDADWLSLVGTETTSLLRTHGFDVGPVIPVSSRTGRGIEELRVCLETIGPLQRSHASGGVAWLPIDRVFTQPGVGTVVAGTLVSGRLETGDRIVVQPSGIVTTIRQLQSQGNVVSAVATGQRVAINLAGVERSAVRRGDVLSDHPIRLSSFADIQLRLADDAPVPISSGDPVRVLTGTTRRSGRVRLPESHRLLPGQSGLAELVFDQPVPLRFDDRVILRRSSPPSTLGGGVVLASHTDRPRGSRQERWSALRSMALGDPVPELKRRLSKGPITLSALTADLPGDPGSITGAWLVDGTALRLDAPEPGEPLIDPEAIVVSREAWDGFAGRLVAELTHHHAATPQSPGMALTQVRSQLQPSPAGNAAMIDTAIRRGLVVRSGPDIHLPHHRPRLSAMGRDVASGWLAKVATEPLGSATLTVLLDDDELAILERDGELIRLRDGRFVTTGAFERFGRAIVGHLARAGRVDLKTVRDAHALGRDAAQRLLERLDDFGATSRVGDWRTSGPHAAAWHREAPQLADPPGE